MAFHRTRTLVYLLAFPLAAASAAFGIVQVRILPTMLALGVGVLNALVFYAIYRQGIDRRLSFDLNPLWMLSDILFITWGVVVSGGISSPWFIWYLSNAAAAAFVGGRRAALWVVAGNTAAYVAALHLRGDITDFGPNLNLALFRMTFMAGASWFLLLGIANAQEKRQVIRKMKAEESRKVEELTSLTRELHSRSSELAEANEKIREADRLKSQFLANMSHELRTPMNSIIGFSEILLERLRGEIDAKHLNFLEHILSSGQHLLGIINDILDLSKIEAGRMEIFPERFDIRPVMEGICHVMRSQAAKHGVHFEISIPDDLPMIETDLAKFKQTLYNLVSNAVKFSYPGSAVGIDAGYREPDHSLIVSVSDQGIGIAPEHHALIWEEFRQVDPSARREFGGTGLGLALVRKFVEIQKGSVWLESEPGRGSTFSFSLPVDFDGITSEAHVFERKQVAAHEGERVLVVEDDEDAYDSIARYLLSAGYFPIRARHSEEAISLARQTKPVAVTLDLVLPGAGGFEILQRLKADEETRDIPVIIISILDNRELGIALGADDYLLKPVDRERLIERLRQLSASSAFSSRQILLIDDDRAVLDVLREALIGAGYRVETAMSGAAGLRLARQHPPDIIILDLIMPDFSGFEVAKALKEMPDTSHIPLLILTSKELTTVERERLHSRMAALVPKGDSSAADLLTAIRELDLRARRDSAGT